MKNILIVSHAMEIGGAERALLGLLEAIDTKRVQVDLFLMQHCGPFLNYIPDNINLLPEIEAYTYFGTPMSTVLKKGKIRIVVCRVYAKFKAWVKTKELKNNEEYIDSGIALEYSHKYCLKLLPKITDKEYDLVLSYLTPHYIARHKINAKTYIARVCTDYTNILVDMESEPAMWDAYNAIIANSESTAESFSQSFPFLSDKVDVVENCLSVGTIRRLAEEKISRSIKESADIVLLSVGRFAPAKNFDNIPDICRRIMAKGIDVKWYIIGFGNMEEIIMDEIKNCNVQDNVSIIGKKDNPYPYIKECDIYVQPSRFEGKSNAVVEAQILGKPVVITDYPSSKSQLNDGIDGIIVPMDNEGCAKGIIDLIRNKQLREELITNCKSMDYSNKHEVKKIYSYVGEE